MDINKNSLRTFRTDFAEAVENLEKQYGVSIELAGIRYSSDSFHGKVTVSNISGSVKVADMVLPDAAKREFELFAHAYGLTADMFGKTFVAKGKTLTIVGINRRASKNCVMLKDAAGSEYHCSADMVKLFLK